MATQVTTLSKIGKYLRKTASKAWNPGARDLGIARATEGSIKQTEGEARTILKERWLKDENAGKNLAEAQKRLERQTKEYKAYKLKGNMKNLAARGAIVTAVVGTPVGLTLKTIKKQSIEDNKYYVLKNDKVIHEFVKKEDAQKYAAVHNGAVNKGTTLKQKVAG